MNIGSRLTAKSSNKKYRVYLMASDYMYIEAEDETEAEEIALELASQNKTQWEVDQIEEIPWVQR